MGGEDWPADVAVGGHGCQFPPGEKEKKKKINQAAENINKTPENCSSQCEQNCTYTDRWMLMRSTV